jgi:hypothetical protein
MWRGVSRCRRILTRCFQWCRLNSSCLRRSWRRLYTAPNAAWCKPLSSHLHTWSTTSTGADLACGGIGDDGTQRIMRRSGPRCRQVLTGCIDITGERQDHGYFPVGSSRDWLYGAMESNSSFGLLLVVSSLNLLEQLLFYPCVALFFLESYYPYFDRSSGCLSLEWYYHGKVSVGLPTTCTLNRRECL